MRKLRVAMAQINVTVGDLDGNRSKIADFLSKARRLGADLVLFPELAVTGYPPEDLLFNPTFLREASAAVQRLLPSTRGLTAIVGFVDQDRRGSASQASLFNAAAVLADGRLVARYRKMHLPNYGVFDERRYFTPGERPMVLHLSHRQSPVVSVGISICEDSWVEEGPARSEAAAGAHLLINISASPYHAGKIHLRERLVSGRARTYRSWVCYANLVGCQDELVFDGGSLVADPTGRIVFRAPQFEEGLFLVDIPLPVGRTRRGGEGSLVPVVRVPWKPAPKQGKPSRSASFLPPEREVFEALVLGTRDYVRKNGFSHVVLGLSGGIDSALTAAIAVAALGKGAVIGVTMPSRYSSSGTRADAQALAKKLGIRFLKIPIENLFQAYLETLKPVFGDRPADVTEENLQARIRGTLLMALSNKFHWLVLATGNKSELSPGYCTLYGDMVGGFAVIKDVPKTLVYRLSRLANRVFKKAVISESVFKRPPTAELKPNQRDQDTLPSYNRLDAVVKAYVEENEPAAEIRKKTRISRRELNRVLRMIDVNEYKRRQAPIGIKITPRAFGKDRRMPITNRFRER